jgi:tRNA A58 N-methylase Trm61
MLDKKSKLVLVALQDIPKEWATMEELSRAIPKDSYESLFSSDKKSLGKTVRHLDASGLAECKIYAQDILRVNLTYVGENYTEFKWYQRRDF